VPVTSPTDDRRLLTGRTGGDSASVCGVPAEHASPASDLEEAADRPTLGNSVAGNQRNMTIEGSTWSWIFFCCKDIIGMMESISIRSVDWT